MSEATQIAVTINGEPREIAAGQTVRQLLESLELVPRLVVVERNGQILRSADYDEVEVEPGDALELVHFVGGG